MVKELQDCLHERIVYEIEMGDYSLNLEKFFYTTILCRSYHD